jgi:hypothetical protein
MDCLKWFYAVFLTMGVASCFASIQLVLCISNIDNTPATKKRQATTGVRQKASTAHSSITTALMD